MKRVIRIWALILLPIVFFAGGWLHKQGIYPFGPGGLFTAVKLWFHVEDTDGKIVYNEKILKEIQETRENDFLHLPLVKAKSVLENTIDHRNQLSWMYSDLDFKINLDSKFCPPLKNNAEFFEEFKSYKSTCIRIYYLNNTFDTYAILFHSNKVQSGITIYNHGHGDMPEGFEIKFLQQVLERGQDVLLTSLPFLGLNTPRAKFYLSTYDGPSSIDYTNVPHEIFQVIDVGSTHFLRFFVDSIIAPMHFMRKKYKEINFVGLSGGAAIGLPVCVLLKKYLKTCVLASGVMPLDLRAKYKNSFGDAEQMSNAFYRKHPVRELLNDLFVSNVRLFLTYNDQDSCCFRRRAVAEFKESMGVNSKAVIVRNSNKHDFDVDQVLGYLELGPVSDNFTR